MLSVLQAMVPSAAALAGFWLFQSTPFALGPQNAEYAKAGALVRVAASFVVALDPQYRSTAEVARSALGLFKAVKGG